jgi:O-antigen ligase
VLPTGIAGGQMTNQVAVPQDSIHPIARKETYLMLFLLLLVFTSSQFFNIGSWWYRSGVFNIVDVGNALIWVGVLFAFSFSVDRKKFWNPISLLIVFYILFVLFTVVLARFNYGQSFFDGLVAVRHQFYYLMFFLFVTVLKDTDKLRRFLDVLVVLSLVLVVLGIVNYFGPTIFSHKWAEGHGIRSGILRAYIPGMPVITLATIWAFTKWLESGRGWEGRKSLLATIFLLGALLFRQTRMRIISVAVVVWAALLVRRKWKRLVVFLLISVAALAIMNVATEKNVLVSAFSTAFADVADNTGTYPGRYEQLVADLREFTRHPWMGSGAGAVRSPTAIGGSRLQFSMQLLTAKSDLGYSSWLSSYGLVGAVWFFLFFYVQFFMVLKVLKRAVGEDNILAHFALSYLVFELVSFITLPHLMHPESIILNMLVATIVVRLYYKTRAFAVVENNAGDPERKGKNKSAVGLS